MSGPHTRTSFLLWANWSSLSASLWPDRNVWPTWTTFLLWANRSRHSCLPSFGQTGMSGPHDALLLRRERRVVLARMQVGNALLNLLIDLIHGEVVGDANRVLDRFRVRASVTDDAAAAHAEERRAAVLGVVHSLFQSVERALREQRADLALHASRQLFAQCSRHEFAERL